MRPLPSPSKKSSRASEAGLLLSLRDRTVSEPWRMRLITTSSGPKPSSPSKGVSVPPRSESAYRLLPAVPGALATKTAAASTSNPESSKSDRASV